MSSLGSRSTVSAVVAAAGAVGSVPTVELGLELPPTATASTMASAATPAPPIAMTNFIADLLDRFLRACPQPFKRRANRGQATARGS
jgi:hypothetical protein